MAPSFIPSELRLSRQADLAVEQALVKGGAGLVACGLASFVLFGKILCINLLYFFLIMISWVFF